MPDLTIRAVGLQDLAMLERWQPTGRSRVHEQRLARQTAGASTYLVAFGAGGEAVGSCELRWSGNPAPEVADDVPEVNGLQVWPVSGQGQGIGSALLDHVEELARSRGHRHLGLGVAPVNDAAARMYLRRGYIDAGIEYVDRYVVVDDDGLRGESADECRWLVKVLG